MEDKNLAESSGGISGTHQSPPRSNPNNQAHLTAKPSRLILNGPLREKDFQRELEVQTMKQHFLFL